MHNSNIIQFDVEQGGGRKNISIRTIEIYFRTPTVRIVKSYRPFVFMYVYVCTYIYTYIYSHQSFFDIYLSVNK